MGGLTISPDFGMISAIYNDFHNTTSWNPVTSKNRAEQVVDNVCTTGNCTWSAFTSSAICSSCNDLSAQVVKKQKLGNGGSNIPLYHTINMTGNYSAFTLRNANLSDDDTAKYEPASGSKSTLAQVSETLLTANTTFNASETTNFQDMSTLIASFFIIMRAFDDWLEGKVAWNASRPTATECALYFCANMYEGASRDGKLEEIILSSWVNRNSSSYQANSSSTLFEPGPAADAWVVEHGDTLFDGYVPRTDLQLFIPKEESPNVMSFTRSFNISYAFIMSMTDFLMDFTAGTGDDGQLTYPAPKDGVSPLASVLWDSNNLTQTFENVATSLTNQVRNTAVLNRNYHEASRDTLKWVIHVKVQWPYLAFPIATITLGIIYVLLTIVESTRLHVPVWKEAALPSLLHGLDETQGLLREAESQTTDPKAGATIVRFGPDEKDDCLRLIAEKDFVR